VYGRLQVTEFNNGVERFVKMVIKVLRNCSMFLRDKSLATVTPAAAAGGQMETGWDTPD